MKQVDLANHAARAKPLSKCYDFLGRRARPLKFTGIGISYRQA
jgi:hypothetical protein